MSLALLFLYLMLNMFRVLIHPSPGACDLFVELFHGLYCSGSMCVGVTLWFGYGGVVSICRLKHFCDIKLVSLYSSIEIMHGTINIRFIGLCLVILRLNYSTLFNPNLTSRRIFQLFTFFFVMTNKTKQKLLW